MAKGNAVRKKKKAPFPPKGNAKAGKGAPPPSGGDKQLPPWLKGKAAK